MNINESLLNKLKAIRALNEATSDHFSFNTYDDEPDDFSFEYANFGENAVASDIEFNNNEESYVWGKPYSDIINTADNESIQIWSAFNINIEDYPVFFVVDIYTGYIKFGPVYDFEQARNYFDNLSTTPENLMEENLDSDADFEQLKISKDKTIILGKLQSKYLPYIIIFTDRPNANRYFATYGSAVNCFNELTHQVDEAYSQNIEMDHEQIRTEFGEAVYDALDEYLAEYAYNLESILYNEYEWDQFTEWLEKNKGIKLDYAVMVDPENEVVCNGSGCCQCDDSISMNLDDLDLDQYFDFKDECLHTPEMTNYRSKSNEYQLNRPKYNSYKQTSISSTENENDTSYDSDNLTSKYKSWRESRLNNILDEDVVKQGNSWVNKGKEGTHGKFETKEKADAQRRAMFANGYTG